MFRLFIIVFIIGIFLILFPFHSFAGSQDLAGKVDGLQRTIEAQSKNLATSLNQVQEMVGEFQKLRGELDQSLHNNDQLQKVVTDSQKRVQVLEDKLQMLTTQLEELKVAGLLPAAQIKKLDEYQGLQKGLSKVNSMDYEGAVKTFTDFILKNPKSTYVENAQYWVGESYYAMRDFPKAVAEFQKVVKTNPKSPKAPLVLLRQGSSFYEMQSFDDAKAFLGKVVSQFPNTDEAAQASGKIKDIDQLLEQKKKENLEKKSTEVKG